MPAAMVRCFGLLGGTRVVLADRMGCLRGGVIANVVLTPAFVRFGTHFGFRPDLLLACQRVALVGRGHEFTALLSRTPRPERRVLVAATPTRTRGPNVALDRPWRDLAGGRGRLLAVTSGQAESP